MFPLGRERLIASDHGPAIGEGLDRGPTGVEHGFDGKDHPRLEPHAFSRIAVVQYLRIGVIDLADAVPAVLAHHTEFIALGHALDGMPNVTQGSAGTHRTNTGAHGLIGGGHQSLRLGAGIADRVHAAGVAEPAILDHGNVDVENVAVGQDSIIRDPVADHLVDRRADGFGKPVVTDVSGDRALYVDDPVVTEPIELVGRDARAHVFTDHRQDFSGQLCSRARLRHLGCGMQNDSGLAHR
jgi:hypothetical protein